MPCSRCGTSGLCVEKTCPWCRGSGYYEADDACGLCAAWAKLGALIHEDNQKEQEA